VIHYYFKQTHSLTQIAKRGNYGAFLLEQPDMLVPLVKRLSTTLSIPVSVKVRILPSGVEDSLQLYSSLVNAGASMITIHGRTRLQKGPLTGRADWTVVKRAVELFPTIPVLCNGSMSNLSEIRECLEYTQCDGVMCSEALLEYPPIYTKSVDEYNNNNKRIGPGRLYIAKEYLQMAQEYPPEQGGQGSGMKCLKAHFHRFLHADLQVHTQVRDGVASAKTVQDLEAVLKQLEVIHKETNHSVEDEELSWYPRHRVAAEKEADKEKARMKARAEAAVKKEDVMEVEEEVECGNCFFQNDDDGDY